MSDTLTNVTDSFPNDNNTTILLYKDNGKSSFVDNDYIRNLLDYNFDELDFSEYKVIAYDVFNHVMEHNLIKPKPKIFVILKQKENDDFDLLFSIVFTKKKKKIDVLTIDINYELITKKIQLSNGLRKYDDELYVEKNDDIVNDTMCTICLSYVGELVVTPCGHKYHLTCVKSAPKLLCPICRVDISKFLKEIGISDEEIRIRLEEQENEKELEEWREEIDYLDIHHLPAHDYLRICMETLKLSGGDVTPYYCIIYDMILNASSLFSEYSSIKNKREKGVFMYFYDSVVDFITHVIDTSSYSVGEWVPINTLESGPMSDNIIGEVSKVTNFDEEYVVVVFIDKTCNISTFNKNMYKNRLDRGDILVSLLKCLRVKSNDNVGWLANREHKWIKSKLRKLKNTKYYKKNFV
jgi:hypothetical protein